MELFLQYLSFFTPIFFAYRNYDITIYIYFCFSYGNQLTNENFVGTCKEKNKMIYKIKLNSNLFQNTPIY